MNYPYNKNDSVFEVKQYRSPRVTPRIADRVADYNSAEFVKMEVDILSVSDSGILGGGIVEIMGA